MFFFIYPPVDGELLAGHDPADGEAALYYFQGWDGDLMVSSSPYTFVAESLEHSLRAIGATEGVEFEDAFTCRTEEFEEAQPDDPLPEFRKMIIHGVAGKAEIGLEPDSRLVVSDRVREVIQAVCPNCVALPYEPGAPNPYLLD